MKVEPSAWTIRCLVAWHDEVGKRNRSVPRGGEKKTRCVAAKITSQILGLLETRVESC
jgi:hypothetical protein